MSQLVKFFNHFTLCGFYINTDNILLLKFMKIHVLPTKDAHKFSGGCLKCPLWEKGLTVLLDDL